MKIILIKDVEHLGKAGDQLEVKNGYARNYLIPQGMALRSTPQSLNRFKEEARLLEMKKDRALKKSRELAEKLKTLSLTIPVQVGEEDRVFGAVTSQIIAEQLHDKGYEIDKRQIQLDEPIKALGIYDIPIKLHSEISAAVKVWVIKA